MSVVSKARAWGNNIGTGVQAARAARQMFSPPVGGASYYGTQGYRYQQVTEAYRHWSFVAIGCYMRAVAGGDPPQIGRLAITGSKQSTARSKAWAKTRAIRKMNLGGPSEHQEFHEFDHDDPMVRLFRNPNGPDVAYDFYSYVVMFHMLCGWETVWVIRDDKGFPREMWPIPTHWIQMLQRNGDNQPSTYRVQSPWGQMVEIPYDDCVNLTEHSPLNRYEGYAVSTAIGEWLDTYESLVRVRLAQFKNGAVPNVHVALGESYADPDEAFLLRFYAKWFQRFQGENNAGLPLITGPDVTVTNIGGVDYKLYDSGEESIRTEVLAAYGVPQALVTGDPTVDTSAYAPMRTFARFRVNPLLKYYGEVFTEKVVKRTRGYEDAVLFWKDQAPDDPAQKMSEWNSRMSNSAGTPNEFRTAYGFEPFEHGGDDPLLNGAPVPWGTGRKPERDVEIDDAIIGAVQSGSSGEGEDVQDAALNGAQIASLVAVTDAVSEGRLTPEAARAILEASFPTVEQSVIDRIVGSLQFGSIDTAVKMLGSHCSFRRPSASDNGRERPGVKGDGAASEGSGSAGGFLTQRNGVY